MIRVRFAPSPTGRIHVGNVRTALFNYLFVRKLQGTFVLRIEDTDQERSTREYEEGIYQDMAWLGMQADESPLKPGVVGPYRQSERKIIYHKHLEILQQQGNIYPCFCTSDELDKEKQLAMKLGKPPRYSGKCRHLNTEQVATRQSNGDASSLRFKMPEGKIKFNDLVYGEKEFDAQNIGDFIIVRSNGDPIYLFASAVDDIEQKITHVIRGEDGMPNTPRQLAMMQAMGATPPQFVHLPLILGPDRQMLSKRHGSVSIEAFRNEGYLPEAVVNYVALLGWSHDHSEDYLQWPQLIEKFSLEKVSRSAAIFDWEKMKFLNKHHLQDLSEADFIKYWQAYVKNDPTLIDLTMMAYALRSNVRLFSELKEFILPLVHPATLDAEAKTLLNTDIAKQVLKNYHQAIDAMSWPVNEENFKSMMEQVKQDSGAKGKNLFMPIRLALTGQSHGPELINLFKWINKTEILSRIQHVTQNI